MLNQWLLKLKSLLELNFGINISVEHTSRKQHLKRKFSKRVKTKNAKTLAEYIETALEVLANDDFLIVAQPGVPHGFIQFCKQDGQLKFDYMVVARTWEFRNLYWRYRYVLESLGYKPYPYFRSGFRLKLDESRFYMFEETCISRNIQLNITAAEGGVIGRECLRLGLGVTEPEDVRFKFDSWKSWWQWI